MGVQLIPTTGPVLITLSLSTGPVPIRHERPSPNPQQGTSLKGDTCTCHIAP
jgi:hypothetical protein